MPERGDIARALIRRVGDELGNEWAPSGRGRGRRRRVGRCGIDNVGRPRRTCTAKGHLAVPEWKREPTRDDLNFARALGGLTVAHCDDVNLVPPPDQKAGEVGAVRRWTAHVRRPDSCEKCDAHAAPPAPRTGPERPIIVASMPSLPSRALRRSARDPLFLFFLVSVVLCLLRARDLPTIEVSEAAVGFPDVALLLLAALTAHRLRAGSRSLPSPWLIATAAAFAALIVVSSLANGEAAFTSAAKLAELVVLTFAAAVLIDSKERLEALAIVLLGLCVAAAAWALVQFVDHGPGRQPSFLGEHDLAALGTMAVVIGLAGLFARRGRPDSVTLTALIAGSVAVTLGAALASLVGLYLAGGAVIALAIARRDLRRVPLFATIAVVVAITAATLTLRSGDLGFLKPGSDPSRTRRVSTRRAGVSD